MIHKILFIFSSTNQRGAPLVLLEFLKEFKKRNNIPFNIIAQENGDLVPELEKLTTTVVFKYRTTYKNKLFQKLADLKKYLFNKTYRKFIKIINQKYTIVLSNTLFNFETLNFLDKKIKNKQIKLLIYMHEYKGAFIYNQYEILKNIEKADKIISVSQCASNNLVINHNIKKEKIIVAYNFLLSIYSPSKCQKKDFFLKGKKIILSVGSIEYWGKGVDLFLSIALHFKKAKIKDIVFIWIGGKKDSVNFKIFERDIVRMELQKNVFLLENRRDLNLYYERADIVLVPSREESFSLVTLEAAFYKKTVLCFAQTGGAEEILADFPELIVPYFDADSMVEKILSLYDNKKKKNEIGEKLYKHVYSKYKFETTYKKIENEIISLIK